MRVRVISAASALSALLCCATPGHSAVFEVTLPGDGLPLWIRLGTASVTVDSVTVVAAGASVFGDHQCFVCGYPPGPISDWTCWGTNRWVVHTGIVIRLGGVGDGTCYFRDIELSQPGPFALNTPALPCEYECTPFVISSGVACIEVFTGEQAYGDVGCFGQGTDSGVWVHARGTMSFSSGSVVRVHYSGSVPTEATSWGATKAVYR
jgi:hypothetical protein